MTSDPFDQMFGAPVPNTATNRQNDRSLTDGSAAPQGTTSAPPPRPITNAPVRPLVRQVATDAEGFPGGAPVPNNQPDTINVDPEGGEWQFGDQAHPRASTYRWPAEAEHEYAARVNRGDSATSIRQWMAQQGLVPVSNVEAMVDARRRGAPVNTAFQYPAPHFEDLPEADRTTDGAGIAGARGVMSSVPGLTHVAAGLRALTSGQPGSFMDRYHHETDNLNTLAEHDYETHFAPRLAGEIAGGFLIPQVGVERAVLNAERATYEAVLASGATEDVARTAGQVAGAHARRVALTANNAGYGVAHGAGNADNLSDAASGGVVEGSLAAVMPVGLEATGRGVAGAYRGGRRLLSNAAHAVVGEMPAEGAQVVEAAERQGIRVLPADVGPEGVGRRTQALRQTPYGAETVRQAADEGVEGFSRRIGELAPGDATAQDTGRLVQDRFAATASRAGDMAERSTDAVQAHLGAPVDDTAAGQVVKRGLNRWQEQTQQRATQLYSEIPIAPDRQASTTATRNLLTDLTSGMASNPRLSAMFENPRLQRYLDALSPETRQTGVLDAAGRPIKREVPATLSWQDLQEFRTRIGDMLDDPRLSEKIAPRQLRALYGAISSDMEADGTRSGSAGVWPLAARQQLLRRPYVADQQYAQHGAGRPSEHDRQRGFRVVEPDVAERVGRERRHLHARPPLDSARGRRNAAGHDRRRSARRS